jgi:WD40 repeat protein
VIPVLIDGAGMPGQQELPAPLARLSRRNAFFMRHESFRRDADELVTAIERALALDPDPRVERTFRLGHEVHGLAVSADGRLVAAGAADHTARVWEVASGREPSSATSRCRRTPGP